MELMVSQNLLGYVTEVLNGSRRKRLQSQSVVDRYGDPAQHAGIAAEQAANLRLKGKVASIMFRHFHSVYPLQFKKVKTLFYERFRLCVKSVEVQFVLYL